MQKWDIYQYFLKNRFIVLTKADYGKSDIEQQLSRFSKQSMNLAGLSIWNSVALDCVQS